MKKYVKASRSNACVGIWWYTDDGEIWGVTKPADSGVLDGMYVQYSDIENHLTLWRKVVSQNIENIEKQNNIIDKGYKSLERGRVIYNTATACYEVTCSDDLINDIDFRSKIIDYYNLSGNRVDFHALAHYHKVSLTGNPELDRFEYGF